MTNQSNHYESLRYTLISLDPSIEELIRNMEANESQSKMSMQKAYIQSMVGRDVRSV